MDWKKMKAIEPELGRLESSAFTAGQNQASWIDYLHASHETLSKLTGRGAVDERLQSSYAYELARASLFASWSKGTRTATKASKSTTVPTEPPQHNLPWCRGVDRQATFLDVSEQYQ